MERKIISTENLKNDLVPNPDDTLASIFSFAITFNVDEIDYDFMIKPRPDLSKENFSLKELRAHLYSVQRAWNHMMRDPDEEAERIIRVLVKLIREKILTREAK